MSQMEINTDKLQALLQAISYQRDQATNSLAEAYAEIALLRQALAASEKEVTDQPTP